MTVRLLVVLVALLVSMAGAHGGSFCFDEAGAMYAIHPDILRAIAKVESNNQVRAINWNRNGSYDFGVMQINSSWASTIGMERWMTLGDSCSNIKTGAMILAECMKTYGYTWDAIGCYNSRTPDKRDRYARLVYNQLKKIEREAHATRTDPAAAKRGAGDDQAAAERDAGNDRSSETTDAKQQSDSGRSTVTQTAGIALNDSSLYSVGGKGL